MPRPNGALSSLTIEQVAERARALATSIRSYVSESRDAMGSEVIKLHAERSFLPQANEILAEAVWRIGGTISFDEKSELEGAAAVTSGNLLGASQLLSTAIFLDNLAAKISTKG
jgi:2,3-bisphosphoglycerate-independent phosphoglycerate mutase